MLHESYERAEAKANAVIAAPAPLDRAHIAELAQAIATLAAALKDDLAKIERRLDRIEVSARGRT